MKRNFNVILMGFDGTAHVHREDEHDEFGVVKADEFGNPKFKRYAPMTIRKYCIDALTARFKGEEDIKGEELLKRGRLAERLVFAGDLPVEISSEEGNIILECIRKAGASALVYMRVKDLIDNDPPKVEAAPVAPVDAGAAE